MISLVNRQNKTKEILLSVGQVGMDITVSAGEFKLNGLDFSLEQDEVLSVVAHDTYEKTIIGYLVRDIETDNSVLLIDEVLQDGEDSPYILESNGPYDNTHRLLFFKVPPGASTLDEVDVKVFHSSLLET